MKYIKRLILIGIILQQSIALAQAPCNSLRPGAPFEWEGGDGSWNACTGNKLTPLPYPVPLVHNSADAAIDVGYGYGWRIALPYINYVSSANAQLVTADGAQITLEYLGNGNLRTANRQLSRSLFNKSGSMITETTSDKSIIRYVLLSGTKYVLNSMTDVSGRVKTFTWSNGKLQSTRDHLNQGMTFNYNGSTLNYVSYTYEGNTYTFTYLNGELRSVRELESDRLVEIFYDSSHRITKVVIPRISTVEYEYDANGLFKKERDNTGHGILISYTSSTVLVRDSFNNVTTYDFDINKRLNKVTSPLGHYVNYTRSGDYGWVVGVTDSTGASTSYSYTANGDVDLIIENAPIERSVDFDYDANRNVIKKTVVSNNKSYVWQYGYDPTTNQLLWAQDPSMDRVTYSYGASGSYNNLLTGVGREIAQPNAQIYSIGYDAAKGLPNAMNNELINFNSSVSYDPAGRVNAFASDSGNSGAIRYDSMGRVDKVSDATGSTTVGFDSKGEVNSVVVRNANNEQMLSTTVNTTVTSGEISKESTTVGLNGKQITNSESISLSTGQTMRESVNGVTTMTGGVRSIVPSPSL